MNDFTPKSALLTGVDLIRRRPLLILLWVSVLLVQTVLVAWLYHFAADAARSTQSQSVLIALILAVSLGRTGMFLFFNALLWGSAFRAVLRPADRRPLRFGREELHVLGAWFIVLFVVIIVSMPGPSLVASGVNHRLVRLALGAVHALGRFWCMVAAVWAFDRLKVAPFRCWSIARGRFWLLAALVIGVLIVQRGTDAVVHRLAWILPLGRNASGPTILQPPVLLQNVESAVTGALGLALLAGVVARAYLTAESSRLQAAASSPAAGGPPS